MIVILKKIKFNKNFDSMPAVFKNGLGVYILGIYHVSMRKEGRQKKKKQANLKCMLK